MRIAILAVIAGVLAAANPVVAQTNATGRIAGRVTEREAAALPGVGLILEAGPLRRLEFSDADGRYAFDDLPVDATYVLSTQLPGFKTQVFRDLSVMAGRTTTVQIQLRVSCDDTETIVDYSSLGFEDALLTNDTVIHIRVDENSVGTPFQDQIGCRVSSEAPATVLDVVRTRAGQLQPGSRIRIQSDDNVFKAGQEFVVMLNGQGKGGTFSLFKNYVFPVKDGLLDDQPIASKLERMRDDVRRYTRFRTYETVEPTMPLKKLQHQTGWVFLGRIGFSDDPWTDGRIFDFVRRSTPDPVPHTGDRIRLKEWVQVSINDFGARGEELRLDSPAGRESSVANLTGARADAGVVYTVADVVVDGSDAGLRDVWVRLRPK